jgi:hypothetical protein
MTMENCKSETTIHDVVKVVITPEKLSRASPTEIYSTRDLLIYKKDGSIIGLNLFSDGINPIEVR